MSVLHPKRVYISLAVITLLLFVANIIFGAVHVPFGDIMDIFTGIETQEKWRVIILNSRFPQTITALLSGAALAVSGLMLQTLFNNPLAAPSILGISAGSGLGVALVMMILGSNIISLGFTGHLAIVLGSFTGAMVVLGIIILFSTVVKSNVMLLVVGMMVGYIATSAVSLISFYSTSEGVMSFVVWGLGDFTSVSSSVLPYFAIFIGSGLILSLLLIKPLNALLLGERYCENLGINITRARILILISTGILTGVVTAFCGPVSFIGLAVPHVARFVLGSSNHAHLLPVTLLIGSSIALICNLLTVIAGGGMVIPLNVITPLMGAPVIIYVIVNKKKMAYFN